MGSVKDLEVLLNAKDGAMGVGRFEFSDRYSILDWGKMPDKIANKGAALCTIGAYCFEKAEDLDIETHYRGLVSDDGKILRLDEIGEPTNIMQVDLVRVIPIKYNNVAGTYDYSKYHSTLSNCLIPLEIIYRNGLPEGSSVFRRLKEGTITYQDFGLDHYPEPGERFEEPVFDVSTKLEKRDRYITWDEAKEIAALNDGEVSELQGILKKVCQLIDTVAGKSDLVNEDGKIELGYDASRRPMLLDVFGTPDECRFTTPEGVHVSKEVARKFYDGSEWANDVGIAKKEGKAQKIKNWKSLCNSQPEPLDEDLLNIISQMYTATANEFLGWNIFDTPRLDAVVGEYKDWLDSREN